MLKYKPNKSFIIQVACGWCFTTATEKCLGQMRRKEVDGDEPSDVFLVSLLYHSDFEPHVFAI